MNSSTQLVLVPGLLNDATLWQDQIKSLSGVVNVTVADITKGATLQELAASVLAVSEDCFALAGFSLGGIIALKIMRQVPERVSHLALLDTTMLPDSAAQRTQRDLLASQAQSENRFHGFGAKIAASYLSPSNSDCHEFVERVRGMAYRLGREVFLRQVLLERPDNRSVLGQIQCPTLVLCGEHDAITPPDIHQQMAAAIKSAELEILPNAGHLTPIEQPEMVSTAFQRLLARDRVPH